MISADVPVQTTRLVLSKRLGLAKFLALVGAVAAAPPFDQPVLPVPAALPRLPLPPPVVAKA